MFALYEAIGKDLEVPSLIFSVRLSNLKAFSAFSDVILYQKRTEEAVVTYKQFTMHIACHKSITTQHVKTKTNIILRTLGKSWKSGGLI
jgi:hypothetical protein